VRETACREAERLDHEVGLECIPAWEIVEAIQERLPKGSERDILRGIRDYLRES